MSENIEKRNQQDEIDIFEFCNRMWHAFTRFLVSIKDFIVSVIIFLIRKSLWIIGFAIVGIIIGYSFYAKTDRYYSSLLEANSGDVSNVVVINHINKLNNLTSASKGKLLANYLGLKEDEVKKIVSIKAYYGVDVNKDKLTDFVDFNETFNPKDTLNQARVPSYIYIKASVYDENIFPALRRGILQYIESNIYIQELYKISRTQKQQYVIDLEKEIVKIDSLQRSLYQKGTKMDNTQMVVMESGSAKDKDPFYSNLRFDLYNKKQKYEKELNLSDEIVTIIQDFTSLAQEENPLSRYVLIYGSIMAVLGLFCALLWQYRKTIWKLIVTKN